MPAKISSMVLFILLLVVVGTSRGAS